MYAHICACNLYTCMFVCAYIYRHMHLCVQMCLCMLLNVHVFCIHTCLYVLVHKGWMCTYLCIHTPTQASVLSQVSSPNCLFNVDQNPCVDVGLLVH